MSPQHNSRPLVQSTGSARVPVMPIAQRARGFVRKSIALTAALFAAASLAACDSHNAAQSGANPRQVTVFGSGQVQGAPDTLTADVAIEFTAGDVTSAMNQTNDRQQAVINALVDAGQERKDIRTTEVTLQPQYSTPEPGGTAIITSYRAENAIAVKIHPTDAASRLLELIVNRGGDATRIRSVRYSIADDSKLVKDAQTRAFEDAKTRAQQYAQLSGLNLGKVLSISEETGHAPLEGGPAAPSPRASTVPLEPGQQMVSFSVTVIWELT